MRACFYIQFGDPGILGSQEAAEERRGRRCYQVNVLRVIGGSTDVENFRLAGEGS